MVNHLWERMHRSKVSPNLRILQASRIQLPSCGQCTLKDLQSGWGSHSVSPLFHKKCFCYRSNLSRYFPKGYHVWLRKVRAKNQMNGWRNSEENRQGTPRSIENSVSEKPEWESFQRRGAGLVSCGPEIRRAKRTRVIQLGQKGVQRMFTSS